jgi:hypothetical protein
VISTKNDRSAPGPLVAGLLCSLAALPAAVRADELAIDCTDNQVLLDAGVVPRQAVVESVAAACDLRLVRKSELDGELLAPSRRVPLTSLLEQALGEESYLLFLADEAGSGRGALWIFETGDSLSPATREEATLLDGEFSERRATVRELRRLANDEAIRLLSFALADPDERIRAAAAESLAAIGGDEARAALAATGVGSNSKSRAAAAYDIAQAGGASASGYLATMMADADPQVRAAAVQALGELGAPDSAALIRRALDDPDQAVRRAAFETLEDLDDDANFQAAFPGD